MKAKEYAEKYKGLSKPNISADENKTLIIAMFKEMLEEMIVLIKKRNISTISAFEALKKEFNQKGNVISQNLGGVLKRGWFLILYDRAESKGKESG